MWVTTEIEAVERLLDQEHYVIAFVRGQCYISFGLDCQVKFCAAIVSPVSIVIPQTGPRIP